MTFVIFIKRIIMKSSLFMLLLMIMFFSQKAYSQELTMFQGFFGYQYYEDYDKLKKKEFVTILKTDEFASSLWKQHKVTEAISIATSTAGLGLMIYSLNFIRQPEVFQLYYFAGLGFSGVSLGVSIFSNNLRKNAILTYNHNLDVGSIYLGPTYNGIGLVYTF